MGSRYPVKEAVKGLADRFGEFYKLGIKPQMPETASKIQHMFPMTYKIPDRMLLAPSPKEGNPYAAFYINDTMETLHHASEDNRGELYHYEVDGVMYLKRSGWHKWAGQTNTLVVTDSQAEFPFYYTRGKLPGHWYRASSNMRLLRLFTESEQYKRVGFTQDQDDPPGGAYGNRKDETSMPLPLALREKKSPYGLHLSNPKGLAGKNEKITINNVTISLNSFSGKAFNHSIKWYRDHRNMAPAKGPFDIVIDDVFIAGPEGEKTLLNLERIPEKLEVVYYEAGKQGKKDAKRVLSRGEVKEIIEVTDDSESGGKALRVTCRPGRTDLVFRGFNEPIHLTDEYQRIGFNYKYVSEQAENYLRTPVRIMVNRLTCRGMYVDRQQGGVLEDTFVEEKGNDCYGEMTYHGIYTYDSKWTRRTLLTEEGYLIVVDAFLPGEAADGMSGGPVWKLNNPPTGGRSWFDSVADKDRGRNLMVKFHSQRGHVYGVQPQGGRSRDYAVFAKSRLDAGKKEVFISVMIPHDSNIEATEISGQQGVETELSETGDVEVKIYPYSKKRETPIAIEIPHDGGWSINR